MPSWKRSAFAAVGARVGCIALTLTWHFVATDPSRKFRPPMPTLPGGEPSRGRTVHAGVGVCVESVQEVGNSTTVPAHRAALERFACGRVWPLVHPFVAWDAEYFTHQAAVTRKSPRAGRPNTHIMHTESHPIETMHAFFSGFPLLTQWVSQYVTAPLLAITPSVWEDRFLLGEDDAAFYWKTYDDLYNGPYRAVTAAVSGLLVSNVCAVTATLGLLALAGRLLAEAQAFEAKEAPLADRSSFARLGTARVSNVAAGTFAFTAASVHFTAPYAETLFNACTFWGLAWLSDTLQSSESDGCCKRMAAFVVRLSKGVAATALLGWAALTRSNGVLLAVPVLLELMAKAPSRKPPEDGAARRRKRVVMPLTVAYWTAGMGLLAAIALPLVSHLGYGVRSFCLRTRAVPRTVQEAFAPLAFVENISRFVQLALHNSGLLHSKRIDYMRQLVDQGPEFCRQGIPSIYGYVQRKHWNVRPFGYWSMTKLERWVLVAPFMFFSAAALRYFLGRVARTAQTASGVRNKPGAFDVEQQLEPPSESSLSLTGGTGDATAYSREALRNADPLDPSPAEKAAPGGEGARFRGGGSGGMWVALCHPFTRHCLHQFILLTVFVFFANCEPFIRISTCLVLHPIFFAVLLLEDAEGTLGAVTGVLLRVFVFWTAMCHVLGPLCFAKYFDWT